VIPSDGSETMQGRLLDERVVTLFGRLDDAAVSDLAARLWSLDAIGDAPINLLLSVSASTTSAAAALVDVTDVIGVELHATCIGAMNGPAVAVLAAAQRREAGPNARFVLRDEPVAFQGSFRDLEESARQHQAQRLQLLARLAESTGGRRSIEAVLADFDRGLALSAEEARDYGIIDHIALERGRVASISQLKSGFGFRRP
jgi:ATP-dependent Clp protease protease subunit